MTGIFVVESNLWTWFQKHDDLQGHCRSYSHIACFWQVAEKQKQYDLYREKYEAARKVIFIRNLWDPFPYGPFSLINYAQVY